MFSSVGHVMIRWCWSPQVEHDLLQCGVCMLHLFHHHSYIITLHDRGVGHCEHETTPSITHHYIHSSQLSSVCTVMVEPVEKREANYSVHDKQ